VMPRLLEPVFFEGVQAYINSKRSGSNTEIGL
jgi:hypothetical protein